MIADFYPRSPCGERLDKDHYVDNRTGISIHALLAESDGTASAKGHSDCNFYPRSPCGERQAKALKVSPLCDFYPRSPCGERLMYTLELANLVLFLSTLSLRRATNCTSIGRPKRLYFYPRSPCGERQYLVRGQRPNWGISIHALLAESDRTQSASLSL